MGLSDRIKGLTKKAEDAAVEHKDQIQQAVQKAEEAADEKTGGKYHDQIQKAGVKANTFIDGLEQDHKQPDAPSSTPEGGAS